MEKRKTDYYDNFGGCSGFSNSIIDSTGSFYRKENNDEGLAGNITTENNVVQMPAVRQRLLKHSSGCNTNISTNGNTDTGN